MNILLINHYAGSTEMGMEFRPYYFAKEWIKQGHNVDIIAGDFSHLRKVNPDVKKDFQTEDIDGIKYHWLKTGEYSGNGVKRALTMFKFVSKLWLNAKKIVEEIKPDVVITSSTYPIDTFAGQKIAKKAKAKLIHEVHDMWPATLMEIGGMSKLNPFVVAMQIGENSAYKRSDYVVSLLPCARKYMMKHGLKEEKFVHIPNGIVLEDWAAPEELPAEHKEILEKLKSDGKFVVGYFGGHALSNALDTLIDAADKLKDKKSIHIMLVGSGVEKERLMKKTARAGLANVTFLSPVPKLSIPNLVQYFDTVYMGAKASSLYRFGICFNKVYDSMMAGKPLLYAIDTPNNHVKKYECGIDVVPEDVDSLTESIVSMSKLTEEDRHAMGARGKKAVETKYNYKVLGEYFAKLFN